jgi:hypothetical protein
MSAETRPIPASQFALAIRDLPLETIYTKAHEIQNSISHLQRSNAQLKEYSDSLRNDGTLSGEVREQVGDRECLEAIEENERVIARQRERVGLLRAEVERRGRVWHEGGDDEVEGQSNGGHTGQSNGVNGSGGKLSDEELRRQMMDRMGDDDGDDGDGREGGLHL